MRLPSEEECLGCRRYELTNHLGNVLAVVSDWVDQSDAEANPSNCFGGYFFYYVPTIITSSDYFPFGMSIPGRDYVQPNEENYRYGFNDERMIFSKGKMKVRGTFK